MSTRSRLDLPQRKPTYRFALTPLADAMFQLLIFFMLSSSLTPYSLLTLQSGPAQPGDATAAGSETTAEPSAQTTPGDTALWTVEAGGIVVGGQAFDFATLPSLAAALGTASAPANVILIVRPTAQVQDITSVLEALQAAEVGSVQVTAGAL